MSKKNKQTLKIDAVDSRIILLLQEDGRMSNKAIARELGIAESTVRTRLKRLIEDRIVKIVALSNPFDLGFEIAGNCKINVDQTKQDAIMEELVAIKELWYVALTTGGTDIDVDFIIPTFADLEPLLARITKIDGIRKVETNLIMRYGKHEFNWGTVIS
ncbi:MAG: Lrp/AsnC family transcriptional regulator [Desulfofustis sp.]|jgi:Lrp/AsnC family transcriptional regulator for asnA, asnC and gidA|nr:Lrp/AsnC family transcriptional regulator [Desulfofustis sp.]